MYMYIHRTDKLNAHVNISIYFRETNEMNWVNSITIIIIVITCEHTLITIISLRPYKMTYLILIHLFPKKPGVEGGIFFLVFIHQDTSKTTIWSVHTRFW